MYVAFVCVILFLVIGVPLWTVAEIVHKRRANKKEGE